MSLQAVREEVKDLVEKLDARVKALEAELFGKQTAQTPANTAQGIQVNAGTQAIGLGTQLNAGIQLGLAGNAQNAAVNVPPKTA